jgi:hypothetical protein
VMLVDLRTHASPLLVKCVLTMLSLVPFGWFMMWWTHLMSALMGQHLNCRVLWWMYPLMYHSSDCQFTL